MIVVSDTTAISSLHKIQQLPLLQKIFGEVIISSEVFEELKYFESINSEFNFTKTYPWIKVETATDQQLIKSLEEILDKGESSAIALAIQLHADLVLIDEKQGRKVAVQQGLSIIGLVGVLEVAKKRNLIPALKPLLNDLIDVANFRISKNLYERTLEAVNEK